MLSRAFFAGNHRDSSGKARSSGVEGGMGMRVGEAHAKRSRRPGDGGGDRVLSVLGETEFSAAAGFGGQLFLAQFVNAGVAIGFEERHCERHLGCQGFPFG